MVNGKATEDKCDCLTFIEQIINNIANWAVEISKRRIYTKKES